MCVSGRNKGLHEWIDVNGIRCRNFCPKEEDEDPRENFLRYWSDVANWPNSQLPLEGENVTIPYQWQLVMDINPPRLNYLEVDGILMIDPAVDRTLDAHYIWVKKGRILAGTETEPFPNKFTITLHG